VDPIGWVKKRSPLRRRIELGLKGGGPYLESRKSTKKKGKLHLALKSRDKLQRNSFGKPCFGITEIQKLKGGSIDDGAWA